MFQRNISQWCRHPFSANAFRWAMVRWHWIMHQWSIIGLLRMVYEMSLERARNHSRFHIVSSLHEILFIVLHGSYMQPQSSSLRLLRQLFFVLFLPWISYRTLAIDFRMNRAYDFIACPWLASVLLFVYLSVLFNAEYGTFVLAWV